MHKSNYLTIIIILNQILNSNSLLNSTCQCGVFLLSNPPLIYSTNNNPQPALAGHPISTNCSLPSSRSKCSSECRSLIDVMNTDNVPLVQSLVLLATRSLACSKFNNTNTVPVPRKEGRNIIESNIKPHWLGGFYRWCDNNWIYNGVSINKPLCCEDGKSVECPVASSDSSQQLTQDTARRSPRLIIKKRPEDDLSSEEIDEDSTVRSITTTTTQKSTTTTIEPTTMEKIVLSTEATTTTNLNSTILAEAFGIVTALMRSLGLSDVVDGISTVLPSSTATELLKKVDVGGWVGKYQERYIVYGREFNMAYCYLEYGLYNVAAEGVVSSLMQRVFGGASSNPGQHTSGFGGTSSGHGGTPIIQHPNADRLSHSNLIPPHHNSVAGQELGSNLLRRVRRTSEISKRNKKPVTKATSRQQQRPQQNQNQGPNLMNMANMLLQLAGNSGNGDPVNLLQNALPLMAQVGSSPMIQGVVSNLVTSFLTPPDSNRPDNKEPVKQSENHIRPTRPNNSETKPSQQVQQTSSTQDSGLSSMFGQIVQTYIKHYFDTKTGPPPPTSKPINSNKIDSITTTTSTPTNAEPKLDIVDTISEVAKPFFISYFGLVPGRPGFGQLNIAERSGRVDTLTYDPDPGTSLTDLLFGSLHLPQTGNSLFDFGNRVAFAFSRANDPTQGMYCFKQYSVNKLWDGFRFGIRTLFK